VEIHSEKLCRGITETRSGLGPNAKQQSALQRPL
jgi:hypothetical protein